MAEWNGQARLSSQDPYGQDSKYSDIKYQNYPRDPYGQIKN